MMVMDASAGQGLILHEVGHNYTMGMLANNEWREAFLDEGFTDFQTGWFAEAHGRGSPYPELEARVLFLDLERWSEPVSMVSERYRDFETYGQMVYAKAQLFYEQLRYVVGDAAMRRILRTYYARWKLKHVDESAGTGAPDARSPGTRPRLRHAEQPGAASRRGAWGVGVPDRRSDAGDRPAGPLGPCVDARRVVQRRRGGDARAARALQLPRRLRPRAALRHGRHAPGRDRKVRRLPALRGPDRPPHAAHPNQRRGLGDRGAGGRGVLDRSLAAAPSRLPGRPPRRVRRAVDGDDQPHVPRPPPVGRCRDA